VQSSSIAKPFDFLRLAAVIDQLKRVTFIGGGRGQWIVESMRALVGRGLRRVEHVAVVEGPFESVRQHGAWRLRGVTSHERYVTRAEQEELRRRSPALGRREATRAVLIPIRKTNGWWELAQDERRAIFEEQSHHVQLGLRTLPAVARRLHHSRELGEPFDFLTWFEFAPPAEEVFNELLRELRRTTEWTFVEREVEIRLRRAVAP
jgi:Chlorite dismutase